MKTVGIAMLFGLCCVIGMRLGAKKTAYLRTVRSLRCDLQLFSERIGTCSSTLKEIAGELSGTLSTMMHTYLDRLDAGCTEADAAEYALDGLQAFGTVQAGMRMFLTGLSTASRKDLMLRSQTLAPMLERAEAEAEAEAKQARVLRISGVLIGAGLAILLL